MDVGQISVYVPYGYYLVNPKNSWLMLVKLTIISVDPFQCLHIFSGCSIFFPHFPRCLFTYFPYTFCLTPIYFPNLLGGFHLFYYVFHIFYYFFLCFPSISPWFSHDFPAINPDPRPRACFEWPWSCLDLYWVYRCFDTAHLPQNIISVINGGYNNGD